MAQNPKKAAILPRSASQLHCRQPVGRGMPRSRSCWTESPITKQRTARSGFGLVCGPARCISLHQLSCSNCGLTDTDNGHYCTQRFGGQEGWGREGYTPARGGLITNHTWLWKVFKLKERSFVKYSLYIFIIWLKGAIFYFVQYVTKTWDIYFFLSTKFPIKFLHLCI